MKERVTLIVVPREQFSLTKQSLESIYQHTNFPFKLIYVDINSPPEIEHYLETESIEKSFKLIRSECFLCPNHARNIALQHVCTEYIAFIDNDVLVKAGWLEALVNCADETGAWVVGPLCLEGTDFNKVHMAGGSFVFKQRGDQKWVAMKRPWFRMPLAKVRTEFKRQACDIVELHCCLVRKAVFEQLGQLDEQIMSVGTEEDLCLTVLKANKSVYFEPAAIITYVPPVELSISDIPFFFTRWSNAWFDVSVKRLQEKWSLTKDSPLLKGYQVFLKGQKYLICPRPKRRIDYPIYLLKKASIKLVEKLFDIKALLTMRKGLLGALNLEGYTSRARIR